MEKKVFEGFIKERGLKRSFTEYKKLKSTKKTSIEIITPDYLGGEKPKKIILYRKGSKTIIRDHFTLKVLGRSNKKVREAIKSLNKKKADTTPIKVYDWKIINNKRNNEIKLKIENKNYSYNKQRQRLRTVKITNKPTAFGFAVVDATYVKQTGQKIRIQARSQGGYNLKKSSERKQAIENALLNGSVIAGFSPGDVILNNYWFEIWKDEFTELKKI